MPSQQTKRALSIGRLILGEMKLKKLGLCSCLEVCSNLLIKKILGHGFSQTLCVFFHVLQ